MMSFVSIYIQALDFKHICMQIFALWDLCGQMFY